MLESARSYWRAHRPAILTIAILAAGTLWFLFGRGGSPPAVFQTVAVDRGDIVAKVSASGSLSALVTVDVGSQVSGRIQSLFADYNSTVHRGELIAKIDPALFQAAVDQARANVTAAQGNLVRLQVQAEDAQRQSNRSRELYDKRLISENDRDTALTAARAGEASVRQAQGQLEQARSALEQALTNLRYTDIRAPTDGIVISRAVNVGQTVAASLAAPVIFTIAEDLRQMQVHTNVAESDVGRLRPSMAASFTVDAYPGETFKGRISDIRNAPQVVQNVVTYDAVVDVANPDLKLKPGMTAAVTVVIERRSGVLRVPNAALRFRPPAGATAAGAALAPGERLVWVPSGGSMSAHRLRTGLTDGSWTEIVGGDLPAGAQVITSMSGGAAGSARGGPQFRLL